MSSTTKVGNVYITQVKPGVNILKANIYGKLITLFDDPRLQIMTDCDWILNVLHEKLKFFNSNDYIIPMGDPIIMSAAIAVAAHYNDGIVNVLKWDRQLFEYYSVTLQLY